MEIRQTFVVVVVVLGLIAADCVWCALRPKMSGAVEDASDITWAHAVNSRDALEKALAGSVDFLEADVSMGQVRGYEQTTPIPIMAHPPDRTSDISLDTWLFTLSEMRPDKGVKLDFKSIDALEPSLAVLQKYSSKLNSSVWLNADVLSGPIKSTTIPVHAEKFLSLCHQHFPDATLSAGWTTYWFPTLDRDLWHYGWRHVREMADVIRCRGYESDRHPRFTFPVRGIFAARSIGRLQWLLDTVPNSTLTVWTGKYDPLTTEDLLRIRKSFPRERVYYDLPERKGDDFRKVKNSVDVVVPRRREADEGGPWMTLTRGQGEGCASTMTYAKNGAVVFGKSLETSVLRKRVISLGDGDDVKIVGKIKFFDNTDHQSQAEKATDDVNVSRLTIVLADVSTFSKNASSSGADDNSDLTVSDTGVLWSAVDASGVYTFQHRRGQESTSCRLFKLDSSSSAPERSFQAWTVPCGDEEEGAFEDLAARGVPEISSGKRLVLPENPFMVGFVSAGDEFAAVYDISVEVRKAGGSQVSGAQSSSVGLAAGLLAATAFAVCALCVVF